MRIDAIMKILVSCIHHYVMLKKGAFYVDKNISIIVKRPLFIEFFVSYYLMLSIVPSKYCSCILEL